MTLIQLQYFQTLAYILHYTRASEALHISQPSLSYSIAELEKEMGFPLFAKTNRKVVLTEYGEYFLPYVEKALDLLSQGTEKLKMLANKDGKTVRLGYFYSISTDFIPAMINELYKQENFQDIVFDFSQDLSGKLLQQIISQELDLAFSMHTGAGVCSVPLFYQQLYLVLPHNHPLAGKAHIRTEDFVREPIIVLDESSNLRKVVTNIYDSVSAVPNVAFCVKECNAALQFVARGMGISIIPRVPAIEALPVKFVSMSEDLYRRMVYLTWAKESELAPAAAAVRDFLLRNYRYKESG